METARYTETPKQNKMVVIAPKINNNTQQSAPQYGYIFRVFVDNRQANIFQ
jgi:hypothetical protein